MADLSVLVKPGLRCLVNTVNQETHILGSIYELEGFGLWRPKHNPEVKSQ